MKKNLLIIVGVPRSGSTFFTSLMAKKINTVGYSEPIRDADLYGRNNFSVNYNLFGKIPKLLPYFIKRKISKKTFDYLIKPHDFSILFKETWRMHDGVDFPTDSIKILSRNNSCQILGILRNPMKIIESVVNRNHRINYHPKMACKLIWNQHTLKNFFHNKNIPFVNYEQITGETGQQYLNSFLSEFVTETTFLPFKTNNLAHDLQGIGDERALSKNHANNQAPFRLNCNQISFLTKKINEINDNPTVSLYDFTRDLA